jgi:hypothetical protein
MAYNRADYGIHAVTMAGGDEMKAMVLAAAAFVFTFSVTAIVLAHSQTANYIQLDEVVITN